MKQSIGACTYRLIGIDTRRRSDQNQKRVESADQQPHHRKSPPLDSLAAAQTETEAYSGISANIDPALKLM